MSDRIIDARWLEPPEPMELTLAALDSLAPNERVQLLIHRSPLMLFPILDEWGFSYLTKSKDDGTYEILIWQKKLVAPSIHQ